MSSTIQINTRHDARNKVQVVSPNNYTEPYVNPKLSVGLSPWAGRIVKPKNSIKAGEVLMVDQPYALVPAMAKDEPPFSLCSSHSCNRRISPGMSRVPCPQGCLSEVVWCNETCRSRDHDFHMVECSWLKKFSPEIRSVHGDGDFGVLWMIARILIRKRLQNDGMKMAAESHFERRGWDAVWNLEGTVDNFPTEKATHWRKLMNTYLTKGALEPIVYVDEAMEVLCKVETNSFGLYPGVTGEYPIVTFVSRGDYYGGGIWPTAAMFNHSCCPNVTHRVDVHGNRTFEAERDIEVGEECCISYFDLYEFQETEARRSEINRSWSFNCGCQRCTDEGDFELPHFLKEMDF